MWLACGPQAHTSSIIFSIDSLNAFIGYLAMPLTHRSYVLRIELWIKDSFACEVGSGIHDVSLIGDRCSRWWRSRFQPSFHVTFYFPRFLQEHCHQLDVSVKVLLRQHFVSINSFLQKAPPSDTTVLDHNRLLEVLHTVGHCDCGVGWLILAVDSDLHLLSQITFAHVGDEVAMVLSVFEQSIHLCVRKISGIGVYPISAAR